MRQCDALLPYLHTGDQTRGEMRFHGDDGGAHLVWEIVRAATLYAAGKSRRYTTLPAVRGQCCAARWARESLSGIFHPISGPISFHFIQKSFLEAVKRRGRKFISFTYLDWGANRARCRLEQAKGRICLCFEPRRCALFSIPMA